MNVLLFILSYAGDWLHSQLRGGLVAFSATLRTSCILSYARDCLIFLQDPNTRCILHLISGSRTIVCTLHLVVHVLVLLHEVLATPNLLLNAYALMTMSSAQLQLALKCVHFTGQEFLNFVLNSLHSFGEPYVLQHDTPFCNANMCC